MSVHLPVADAYDRWAASYDGYDNPMVFVAGEVLGRELASLAGLDVFEFGCGTGRNLRAMSRAGARTVAGCDLSAGMLAQSGLPGVFQHDMTRPLPVRDGAADFVLFALTLEHIERPAGPLAEARRILRRGGRALVIEIHPYLALTGVAAHFRDGEEEITMPTWPHRFEDYLAAFREAGLRVAGCREWRPVDLGTPAPLKALKRGPHFPMTVSFTLVADAGN